MLTAALLSIEECGRAKFAPSYIKNGQDVKFSEYEDPFLDHDKKINAGLAVNPNIDFLTLVTPRHQEMKEESIYLSYDFDYGMWVGPWSPRGSFLSKPIKTS